MYAVLKISSCETGIVSSRKFHGHNGLYIILYCKCYSIKHVSALASSASYVRHYYDYYRINANPKERCCGISLFSRLFAHVRGFRHFPASRDDRLSSQKRISKMLWLNAVQSDRPSSRMLICLGNMY